ncbi:MAG: di-trans,poly-cis-decaprenylcistransferase [Acidobacteria bacterium]|nr:di-trans,poly-cis-decaprenylcistransferase [Acidobacteriota bacterium]
MNTINHVAIIMDGNGRWAQQRSMPRWKGHEMGIQAVRRVSEAACRQEIPILTLFAFSSENWKRPAEEIRILFSLFQRYLVAERQSLIDNDIRVSAFGRRDRLPLFVGEALSSVEEETGSCKRLHLRIALDYGARYEIVEAARALANEVAQGKLDLEQITEEGFMRRLASDGVPDPDLIIRTAGEQRLSNFLLWQAAYSEFYFSSKLWPDFEAVDLEEAIADYRSRTRKYGALACAAG